VVRWNKTGPISWMRISWASLKKSWRAPIREQTELGVHTHYQDTAHDIQLTFYSPEGLSIQLVDTVEYDMQIVDHEKPVTTQHVRARYVAVLTPTEVRWESTHLPGGI